jgi:hypothetical protein
MPCLIPILAVFFPRVVMIIIAVFVDLGGQGGSARRVRRT